MKKGIIKGTTSGQRKRERPRMSELDNMVPSLFTPGLIRSLERIGQQDPGQFAPWNFRYQERKFYAMAFSLPGTSFLWNFRSHCIKHSLSCSTFWMDWVVRSPVRIDSCKHTSHISASVVQTGSIVLGYFVNVSYKRYKKFLVYFILTVWSVRRTHVTKVDRRPILCVPFLENCH